MFEDPMTKSEEHNIIYQKVLKGINISPKTHEK